jgi:hypothetical protein
MMRGAMNLKYVNDTLPVGSRVAYICVYRAFQKDLND